MRHSFRPSASVASLVASFAGAAALACAACGSGASQSDFLDGPAGAASPAGDGGTSSATSSSAGGNTVSLGGTSSSAARGGGTASPADSGTTAINASCNAVSATATQAPVNLVVMLDQSASMGVYTDANQQRVDNSAIRWKPVTNALETFFEDPKSAGLSASLQFFPLGPVESQESCDSDTYASPSVDLTTLPVAAGSDPFANAIGQTSPSGGTPTIEALAGALTYALDTMQSDSTAKYAVVIVTDGDPCTCTAGDHAGCPGFEGTPSDTAAAQEVAALAAKYAAQVPTYVIGVGPDGANLNLIAQGGGTGNAIAVSLTSASQTSADLQAALDKIRTTTLSCNFAIPPAPTNQTYDINAVNVQFTAAAGGTPTTLPYDPTCSGATGWHYDDPTAPTEIVLCGSSCTAAQAAAGGSIDVAFGCETVGGIPGYDGGVVVR